jgi:uncharacterized protein YfkK (UPF0435 family)
MSLAALLEITEKLRLYNAGKLSPEETAAIDKRFAESRERMRLYDIEIEEKVRASVPSAELLRKTCSI